VLHFPDSPIIILRSRSDLVASLCPLCFFSLLLVETALSTATSYSIVSTSYFACRYRSATLLEHGMTEPRSLVYARVIGGYKFDLVKGQKKSFYTHEAGECMANCVCARACGIHAASVQCRVTLPTGVFTGLQAGE